MKKRTRQKLAPPPEENDLAFPPPFSEQAKYLALADQFLASNQSLPVTDSNLVSIESSKAFKKRKHKNYKRTA
jgi:hypothetical protein